MAHLSTDYLLRLLTLTLSGDCVDIKLRLRYLVYFLLFFIGIMSSGRSGSALMDQFFDNWQLFIHNQNLSIIDNILLI